MTLHNAKGLEYDVVFMIGCEDGVFPHSRSVDEGNLEEERRLCYVGITRARERLYAHLRAPPQHLRQRGAGIPSRFLGEIPDELVERHSTALRGRPAGAWGAVGRIGRIRTPSPSPARRSSSRVGDDVIHASFGEGVVTAVEPGNVVVVRFQADGGDRKLMADYAPVQKVGAT